MKNVFMLGLVLFSLTFAAVASGDNTVPAPAPVPTAVPAPAPTATAVPAPAPAPSAAPAPVRTELLYKTQSSLVSGDYQREHVLQTFECTIYTDGTVSTKSEVIKVGPKAIEPVVPAVSTKATLVSPYQMEQIKMMIEGVKGCEAKLYTRFYPSTESARYVAVFPSKKQNEKIHLELFEANDGSRTEEVCMSPYTQALIKTLDNYCGR